MINSPLITLRVSSKITIEFEKIIIHKHVKNMLRRTSSLHPLIITINIITIITPVTIITRAAEINNLLFLTKF